MVNLTILVHEKRFQTYRAFVRRAVMQAMRALEKKNTSASKKRAYNLTVVLTNDAELRELNHQYRGKNKPTNVLAFADGSKQGQEVVLGDILIAFETVKAEAKAQGKKLNDHLAHMCIHGVLHLFGYDHHEEVDAKRMENMEIKILKAMGIVNPYLSH